MPKAAEIPISGMGAIFFLRITFEPIFSAAITAVRISAFHSIPASTTQLLRIKEMPVAKITPITPGFRPFIAALTQGLVINLSMIATTPKMIKNAGKTTAKVASALPKMPAWELPT